MVICAQCGSENPPNQPACASCGQPLSEKVHEGPVGELPPGPITVGSEAVATSSPSVEPPPAVAPVVPPPPGIATSVVTTPPPIGQAPSVTNDAIVALVLALVSVFCGCGIIFGPIAIVQANKALATPGADTSMANMARVLGIVGTIIGVFNLLFLIAILVIAPMLHR